MDDSKVLFSHCFLSLLRKVRKKKLAAYICASSVDSWWNFKNIGFFCFVFYKHCSLMHNLEVNPITIGGNSF